jgi:hypothetical protein
MPLLLAFLSALRLLPSLPPPRPFDALIKFYASLSSSLAAAVLAFARSAGYAPSLGPTESTLPAGLILIDWAGDGGGEIWSEIVHGCFYKRHRGQVIRAGGSIYDITSIFTIGLELVKALCRYII